jgi:hypothetical protein
MNAMNALVPAHKPGSRLPQLSPFEPGEDLKRRVQRQIPVPESAYGCVEWFQYLDHPVEAPALAAAPLRH